MIETTEPSEHPVLAERLSRLANTPAPPDRIDIAQARSRGRRIRRRHRVGTAAGSVAAVGLAAAVGVAVLPSGSKDSGPSAEAGRMGRYSLVIDGTFGWLPPGLRVLDVKEDHLNGRRSLQTIAATGQAQGPFVTLTTYHGDSEPPKAHLAQPPNLPSPLPASPVNGNPAHWIRKPHGLGTNGRLDGIELRWRYGKGAWADLLVSGTPLENDIATINRIAESIKFGGGTLQRFPVSVAGIPRGFTVVGAEVNSGLGVSATPGAPEFRLTLATPGARPNDDDGQHEGTYLAIELRRPPYPPTPSSIYAPNATIDGHPAWDSRIAAQASSHRTVLEPQNTEGLFLYNVQGKALTLSSGPAATPLLRLSGGLTGLAHRITLLGPPQSAWTPTPIG